MIRSKTKIELTSIMQYEVNMLMILLAAFHLQAQALIHSPPNFIKQPPNDELFFQVALEPHRMDKPFLIECEATGEPEPTYRWTKNGESFDWYAHDDRILQQPRRGTIAITRPLDEDSGQYQCFAENEHGIATSNSVLVRKSELNDFADTLPKSVTAIEGEPLTLQCSPPAGTPKPEVKWVLIHDDGGIRSINNSRMTVDPEGNLHFSTVTRSDATGNNFYACSITSASRNQYKLGHRVSVMVEERDEISSYRYPPTFQYATRKNAAALKGKTVELYCIYGGTPLPQIMWTKNGETIHWNDDGIRQGNYGKSLIIDNAKLDDAGSYTCEVSNGVGNAQMHLINLEVHGAPYFTLEPETRTAATDENVEFKCEAAGVPEPVIKWIHNGKPIEESPDEPRRRVGHNSIYISELKSSDTGNYGCNATNAFGYVYKDVYLNVLDLPPEFVERPQNVSSVDGHDVTFRCRVFGLPAPEVKWSRNESDVTGERYQTLANGDLTIHNIGFADAGQYTCHAHNKFGDIEGQGMLVVKEHTRIITDEPQFYAIAAGEPATFRCNVVADSSLDLNVVWLKDGEEVNFEDDERLVRLKNNEFTISNRSHELDTGIYTCVAKTDLDEARADFMLLVQDVPNPPQVTSLDCDSRSATISWRPLGDNRSPIIYYNVQYKTSNTPDVWTNAFEKLPSYEFKINFNFPMSGVSTYTFRVIAYNKLGPSNPSAQSESCTSQPELGKHHN
ncbi:neuroglian-like [Bradysia coprophila]|uniref:neuroglian-like n=1 Tax=Bradysia coprophila TaxID=38358 RepID=UPI00187DD5B7|nr:neuroglian-like [Bradysia coprophila]